MIEKLIKAAIDMRKISHSLYSNYRVGAAVETESGEIIGGCNIESSSYRLTCCAERVTLYSAISKGYNDFKSMAMSTENDEMPCGAFRQVIWDLCKSIKVYICNEKDVLKTVNSSEFLPDAFDESFLK